MKNKLEIQAEQISLMEVLGLEVIGLTYEECVEDLIQRYVNLNLEVKKDDKEFLRREIKRVLKPNN
jgi:hypothetical protein